MKRSKNVGRQRGICLYMLPLPLFNRHLATTKAEDCLFGWWIRFSVMRLGFSIIIGYAPDASTSIPTLWLNHRTAPWKRPPQGWKRPRTSTKLHVAWTTRHCNAPQHVMLVVQSYRWNCRFIPRYIFPSTLPQFPFDYCNFTFFPSLTVQWLGRCHSLLCWWKCTAWIVTVTQVSHLVAERRGGMGFSQDSGANDFFDNTVLPC